MRKIKESFLIILSRFLIIIGNLWITWIILNKVILLIIELRKEPGFIFGLKRLWSLLNPFELAFNFNFWLFIILISIGLGLITLGKFFKEKASTFRIKTIEKIPDETLNDRNKILESASLHFKPKNNGEPTIVLKSSGLITISGKSIPELPLNVYEPVLEWLVQYIKNPAPVTQLDIDLEYINADSISYIQSIIYYIGTIKNNLYIINWYYSMDSDILEIGNEISSTLQIPVSFIRKG